MTPTDPEALSRRIDDADDAIAAGVDRLLDLAAELSDVLAEIVGQDEARRAAAHALRIPVRRPPARELAAEVVTHALDVLRPYVSFVSAEAADRAAEALQLPTRDLELPRELEA